MDQYNNRVSFLQSIGYTMIATLEEFRINKRVVFSCPKNHQVDVAVGTFINREYNEKYKTSETFCRVCYKANKDNNRFYKFDKIAKSKGHKLISLFTVPGNDYVSAEYECKCGNISSTRAENLKSNKGGCDYCNNEAFKNIYEYVFSEILNHGMELIWTKEEYAKNYKNNQHPLPVICKCGGFYEARLADIKRDKSCKDVCKPIKTKNTIQEKHQTDFWFQTEQFKEQRKKTCIAKYGMEHAQQCKQAVEKRIKTNLAKYGVKYAFCQKYVYDIIRSIHTIKYGVPYPLQNPEIRKKALESFLKNWNAEYPFLSEKFNDLMESKYGKRFFCQTDKFKDVMIERYGNIYYILSEKSQEEMLLKYGKRFFIETQQFRDIMIERYGFPHATQNQTLFLKAMESMLKTKEHVMPSGRIQKVMGYEHFAINYLLKNQALNIMEEGLLFGKDIPTVDYTFDGKNRRYFPDIYVQRGGEGFDFLVEVKSLYTYNMDPEKNMAKFKAASKLMDVFVMFFDAKGELIQAWFIGKDSKNIMDFVEPKLNLENIEVDADTEEQILLIEQIEDIITE